jgi:general secretion pathway protein M
MRRQFRPLEQRLTAISLAGLCLALGYLLLVHWWFTAPLTAMSREGDSLREMYQHYQILLRQRAPLEKQLASTQAQDLAAETLLTGPDTGAAGAQLLGLLASHVQEASVDDYGCFVSNRMPVDGTAENGFLAVKLSVNLDCDTEALARLIYGVENSHPVLLIESLSLRNLIDSASNGRRRLSAQLLIAGYLRSSASSEADQ